ncbi:MAG: type I 3-dehydroquinate dehydratase, partial [Chlamydiales bacterium]|nr:type I 3-dehydroquinate dehydratase [Chlamydiales bacterium]
MDPKLLASHRETPLLKQATHYSLNLFPPSREIDMLFAILTDSIMEKSLTQVLGAEIRLDLFQSIEKEKLIDLMKALRADPFFKILFTLRPVSQGGKFEGDEKQRLDLLRSLCYLGPDYIDLEWDVPNEEWASFSSEFPHVERICSYHDFVEKKEIDLPEILKKIKNPYAHIYKIALQVSSSLEALKMAKEVQNLSKTEKLIGIAMGEKGRFTRILGPLIGNAIDYAPLTLATAPGQIALDSLLDLYGYNRLSKNTKLFALIGDPIDQSVGDRFHNAFFQKEGIDALYVKIAVSSLELKNFIEEARKFPFQGLSVTMPLKEAIIPFLDELSPAVKAIGAVNTISIREGRWIGSNTDGIGALDPIEEVVVVRNKKVVVVGAGGAARSIIYEALQRGAEVIVINRTEKSLFGIQTLRFSHFPQVAQEGYDILINTIPEGEGIDKDWILPGTVVMDIVYHPPLTSFLSRALEKGCKLVYGSSMFTT